VTSARRSPRNAVSLLIDTDGGVDDCLAIVLAMRMAFSDVRGITTTGGNTSVANALRNAVLASRAGNPDCDRSVRFGLGASSAYAGRPFLTIGHTYHSDQGLPLTPDQLSCELPAHVTPAGTVFRELAQPGGLTVVCLGPLTNLATFCMRDADSCAGIERVVVMGGCFSGHGSVPVEWNGEVVRLADFNFYSDPHAARVVLERLGPRVTLVPKELCDRVRLHASEIQEHLNGDSFEQVILREWLRFREAQPGKSTSFALNDPLATLIAGGHCAVEEEEARVDVVCDGIAQGTTRRSASGARVRIVRAIEPSAAKRAILEHLFPSAHAEIRGASGIPI
jgi:purine nucleosidase